MSIRLRFNLIFIATFLTGLAGSALYCKRETERIAAEAVEFETRLQMQMASAVRQFTNDRIKPHFESEGEIDFMPAMVPTFAARETLGLLYKDYPGYSYREAALNPTNPANKADAWEQALIERFRSGAAQGEQTSITETAQGRVMHVARPITISDAACLRCHGEPLAAPEAMRQLYGGKGGFGWKLGETIGAQIVSVPFEVQVRRANSAYNEFLASLVAAFALLFVTLNALLSRMVLRPLASANKALNRLADTDALTGVYNRRAFDHHLHEAMTAARTQHQPLSLISFDLDQFKQVNDRFGHEAGDEVLMQVSATVKGSLKHRDSLARIGGEEFVVILPGTNLDNARRVADSLRQQIAATPVGAAGTVTASFGVTQWDTKEPAPALLARADRALYAAKRGGRNCVESL